MRFDRIPPIISYYIGNVIRHIYIDGSTCKFLQSIYNIFVEENNQNQAKKELYDAKRREKTEEIVKSHRARLIKRITIWSFAVLAVGGAIFGMIKLGGNAAATNPIPLASAVSPLDNIKGNKESKVILVEYSDFQCPACGAYYPMVKKLNEEYAQKIEFVYRHFPLSQHKNANLAARVAEASGRQGKFWEMHDMLFENQPTWSESGNALEIFTSYAEKIGLNMEKFKNDIDLKEIKDKIDADYQSGLASGVAGTPTFFLNGKSLQNPRSYEEFKNILDQAINAGA